MSDDAWDGSERRRASNGETRSVFERHLQTGLAVLIVAGVGWICNSVVDLREQVKSTTAVTAEQLRQVKENIGGLQDQILRLSTDRVTSGDLRRLEERIERIERAAPRRDNPNR